VYGIQAMGEARTKLMLMSMDYLGIRPLLKYMMVLNTFHLPTGFEYRIGDVDGQQQFNNVFGEDLHSDFDFSARYTGMEPALGKQFRAQQLIQMAQQWQQNPWINQYQYTKLMMELLDIREADTLLKSPEQFQQEMMQQMQGQMRAKEMEANLETRGKIIEKVTKFKQDTARSEQDFKHDLILEAIKLDAEQGEAKRSEN
jgi:Lhr-like helicase